jgi:hypothetical protein
MFEFEKLSNQWEWKRGRLLQRRRETSEQDLLSVTTNRRYLVYHGQGFFMKFSMVHIFVNFVTKTYEFCSESTREILQCFT